MVGIDKVPFKTDLKSFLNGISSGTTVAGGNGTFRGITIGDDHQRAAAVLLQKDRYYRCPPAVLPLG